MIMWVILGIIVVVVLWVIAVYNGLIRLKNRVDEAWSDIDVQLKQRHDLVPQLVETVKGYATHEKELLLKITQARTAAMCATTIEEKIKTETQLSNALAGLKVSVEAYPDLKANQNFLQLQEELSDIENKLAAVRRYFNAATTEYNTGMETFPSNLIANSFGFHRETLFDLGQERVNLEEAPKISFT